MFRYTQTNPELTAQDERLLKETVIETDKLGSILHDFHVLLDYGLINQPTVTKNHQLPMKALNVLNDQMQRPLQHGLKRPLQKSFPHINGLYLILRASGLTFADTTSKKPKLIVDDTVLQSWQSLNPTEHYFTLMESWLLRGTSDILGERRGGFLSLHNLPLGRCLDFFLRLPPEGYALTVDVDAIDSLRYFPELHNLALLELFGLVVIEHGPAVAKAGWQIKAVRSTPLGTAIWKLFVKQIYANNTLMFSLDRVSKVQPGMLQSIIQPYFPKWRNNLQWPQPAFRDGLYSNGK